MQTVLPFKAMQRSSTNESAEPESSSASVISTLSCSSTENRGRKRHKVWDHYLKTDDRKAQCNHCMKTVPARANESMKKHLLLCDAFKSASQSMSHIFPEMKKKSLERLQAEQAYLTFSNERANDLLAKVMFTSGASFTLLDNLYFKDFVQCLNSNYQPLGRRHLMENLMYDYLATIEANMIEKLQEATTVTLSVDGWSTRRHESIYGVEVVLSDGTELLYDVIQLEGAGASSDNLARKLFPIIERIGKRKIVALVTDGARNMTRLRELTSRDYPWIMGFSCIVHSLNIVCCKMFKIHEVQDIFSAASSIIQAFTMSNKLTERLKSVKNEVNCTATSVMALSTTRFSSSFLCLKALFDNKDAFIALSGDSTIGLKQELITSIQDDLFWKNVQDLVKIVEPLSEAIRAAESATFRLSDNFFHYIKLVFKMLMRINEKSCVIGRTVGAGISRCLLEGFCKYVKSSMTLLVAHLDCRFRTNLEASIIDEIERALLDHCHRRGANGTLCNRIKDDFRKFSQSNTYLPDVDPLIFWEKARQYRSLAPIAASFFRIVSNSMSCERTFSTMGWLNAPRRSRITTENLVAFTKIHKSLATGAQGKRMIKFQREEALDVVGDEFDMSDVRNDEEETLHGEFGQEAVDLISEISSLFEDPSGVYDLLSESPSISNEGVSDGFDEDILSLFS